MELTFSTCNEILKQLNDLEALFTIAETKAYIHWSAEDKAIARKICAVFHLVGVLTSEKLLPSNLLPQIFYYSIPRARYAAHDYLMEIRKDRGESYWGGFDILVPYADTLGPYVARKDDRLIKEPLPEWVEQWPKRQKITTEMPDF